MTNRQRLDYMLTMTAHHGAAAVRQASMWGSPVAAQGELSDIRQTVHVAKVSYHLMVNGK